MAHRRGRFLAALDLHHSRLETTEKRPFVHQPCCEIREADVALSSDGPCVGPLCR